MTSEHIDRLLFVFATFGSVFPLGVLVGVWIEIRRQQRKKLRNQAKNLGFLSNE